MIPNVSVTPTLDDIQEVLLLAGKHISGLSKGVAQWTGGKTTRVWTTIQYSCWEPFTTRSTESLNTLCLILSYIYAFYFFLFMHNKISYLM